MPEIDALTLLSVERDRLLQEISELGKKHAILLKEADKIRSEIIRSDGGVQALNKLIIQVEKEDNREQ